MSNRELSSLTIGRVGRDWRRPGHHGAVVSLRDAAICNRDLARRARVALSVFSRHAIVIGEQPATWVIAAATFPASAKAAAPFSRPISSRRVISPTVAGSRIVPAPTTLRIDPPRCSPDEEKSCVPTELVRHG